MLCANVCLVEIRIQEERLTDTHMAKHNDCSTTDLIPCNSFPFPSLLFIMTIHILILSSDSMLCHINFSNLDLTKCHFYYPLADLSVINVLGAKV